MDTTLREALRKHRALRTQLDNMLLGDDGDVVEAELKKFVAKRPCWMPKTEGSEPALNLHEFFKIRGGLFIFDGFRDLVLANVKQGEKTDPVATKSTELSRDMPDGEIEEMIGPNHIFTEAQVCATIQKFISEQEGGKEGELLNNGFANLFYTPSCVVLVIWLADHLEWRVNTSYRVGIRWSAGRRVFYR